MKHEKPPCAPASPHPIVSLGSLFRLASNPFCLLYILRPTLNVLPDHPTTFSQIEI